MAAVASIVEAVATASAASLVVGAGEHCDLRGLRCCRGVVMDSGSSGDDDDVML